MQQDSPPLCQEQRSQTALAAWEVVIDLSGVTVLPKDQDRPIIDWMHVGDRHTSQAMACIVGGRHGAVEPARGGKTAWSLGEDGRGLRDAVRGAGASLETGRELEPHRGLQFLGG